MSNNVALFEGIHQLPAHLQGYEIDEATKKLAGGGGGLRISIKGGVWRLLDGGEELGRIEDRHLNVVVVNSSPDTARTYYDGTFVEGENKPPSCWSADGKTPDADVVTKQSPTCAMCPQNVAGSGQNDSRACRFSRALAVTLANDMGGKVFKINLPAQSIFGKPENGIMPLQAYAKVLLAQKVGVSSVVTEMRFDTTSATPKVGFKPIRFLTKEEFDLAKQQGASPEAMDAIKTTVFQQDGGAATAPLQIAGSNPAEQAAEPVTMGNTATVAASPPKSRVRAKPAPAAQTADTAPPTSTTGTSAPSQVAPSAQSGPDIDEEEEALLAALAAKRAAKEKAAAAAVAEPVVVKQQAAQAAPPPSSAAAVLANWDTEEE